MPLGLMALLALTILSNMIACDYSFNKSVYCLGCIHSNVSLTCHTTMTAFCSSVDDVLLFDCDEDAGLIRNRTWQRMTLTSSSPFLGKDASCNYLAFELCFVFWFKLSLHGNRLVARKIVAVGHGGVHFLLNVGFRKKKNIIIS